jgi:hypothetical protein
MPTPKTSALSLAKQVAVNLKGAADLTYKDWPAADNHGMVNNPPLVPLLHRKR